MELRDYPARRVALLKPSALGDIVHSLPVLTALRRRYPGAHLTWVVNRAYAPLLEGHPDLDAVLPFDRGLSRSGWRAATAGWFRFFQELRQQRFDLVVDLQGLLRTGLMALAAGAARRVGLATAREGSRWAYTDEVPVPEPQSLHAVDRYWRVAEALGAGDGPKLFRLPAFAAERAWAGHLLAGYPRPWLMLGVGSRWLTKRWPPEHFAALARKAQENYGGTAVFVGGVDETPLAEAAASRLMGPVKVLTGATTLPQLAGLLAAADVVVANDTGPLHLAVALGRPVVAPYTCTRVRLTGPYEQAGNAVETRVGCRGSLLKRCARLECMTELTPDKLWPILEGELRVWQSKRRSA